MRKHLGRAVAILVIVSLLFIVRASQAQTIQATTLTLTSPAACPTSGCAAGQRLNLRATFTLGDYLPIQSPNVGVCIYTSAGWAAEMTPLNAIGIVTGAQYQAGTGHCAAAPAGFALLAGASTTLSTSQIADALDFALRIGASVTSNGLIILQVMEHNGSAWIQTDQSLLAVQVVSTASTVYVANDAAACSINSPCYVNSGDDLPGGLGTGLKDAIDAQPGTSPGTIYVLGNYLVKSNAVLLDKPLKLLGLNDAQITYAGSVCTQPVLIIAAGATVGSLTITDGACTATNRDLIQINSPADVTLEANDLLGGKDAVRMLDNSGNLNLQFNRIQNNSGFAFVRETGPGTGSLTAVGNNLYGNQSGVQVNCAGKGEVNHNFWGFGISPATAAVQCTFTEGKQLGAPGLPRTGAAGVDAQRVTVGTAATYAFNSKIGYWRSSDGADFDLFIVNHGFGAPENVPFTGGAPDSLIPCSNYWDIFLAKGAIPSQALTLAFRYDLNSGCTATIESNQYCGSSNPALYPLWWYDPVGAATGGWDTTGQTGQTTTCNTDTAKKEIQVVIDGDGRPNLANDLNFSPFVVGISPVSSSVVITRFVAISGDASATIEWTTSSESNLRGFYVLRSLTSDGAFTRVSSEIASLGSSLSGASYTFTDNGLTNGTTYYYRLEIVTTSGESTFSGAISVTAGLPTATPTASLTPTPTITATPTITPTGPTPTITGTITQTRTITPTRTITSTRIPTRTRTPVRYSTYFYYRSPTLPPTRSPFPTRTFTPLPTASPLTGIGTGSPAADTATTGPQGGYPAGSATITVSGPGYPAEATEVAPTAPSTATPTILPLATETPPSTPGGGRGIARLVAISRNYWPYILGLFGLEILVLAVAGFILYRKGLISFPLLPKKK